jgi:hypothetical protein
MKLKNLSQFVLCSLILFSILGCGAIGRYAEKAVTGDKGMGNVADLWPDVPAFPGSSKTDAELPMLIRLAIDGFLNSSKQDSKDFRLDSIEFISFTTQQGAQDVQSFYTTKLMESKGWNLKDQPGCFSGGDSPVSGGAFCLFGRSSGTSRTMLFVVAVRSNEKEPATIFFVRAAGTDLSKNANSDAPIPSTSATPAEMITPKPGTFDLRSFDACAAVPTSVVEQVLGRQLSGKPEKFSFNNKNTDAGCTLDAGKDADKNAYFAYVVAAPVDEYVVNRTPKAEFVKGIVDEAYFVNGADARQLWVLVDGKAAVMVAIGDRPNDTGARNIATEIIKAIK